MYVLVEQLGNDRVSFFMKFDWLKSCSQSNKILTWLSPGCSTTTHLITIRVPTINLITDQSLQ